MSEFGIQTADHHLDVFETPPGQTANGHQAEFQWTPFQTWLTANNWNDGRLPAFAGRYFLEGAAGQRLDANSNPYQQPPFQWGHGEGSAAPALLRIAPLQAADPNRQSAAGPVCQVYGWEDATDFCKRLAVCVVTGELSISNTVINVFLDVADGAGLTPEYWAQWADTVYNFMVPGQPSPTQPFLPCICCSFAEDPNTHQYSLDPQVSACLNTAQLNDPSLHARCYGLWAKAADPTNLNQALDFSRFPAYVQPMTATGSEPVWVLIWRYAEQADPPDPNFAGGNRLSLEATNEADTGTVTLNRMLKTEAHSAAASNTLYLGVDRATPFSGGDANCLVPRHATLVW
jgi:hypothetical protein